MKKNKSTEKGFSLMELVIVIAVIGVLAAILVPTIKSAIKKSNAKSALSDARNFATKYGERKLENDAKGGESQLPDSILMFVEKSGRLYLFDYNTSTAKAIRVSRLNALPKKKTVVDVINEHSWNVLCDDGIVPMPFEPSDKADVHFYIDSTDGEMLCLDDVVEKPENMSVYGGYMFANRCKSSDENEKDTVKEMHYDIELVCNDLFNETIEVIEVKDVPTQEGIITSNNKKIIEALGYFNPDKPYFAQLDPKTGKGKLTLSGTMLADYNYFDEAHGELEMKRYEGYTYDEEDFSCFQLITTDAGLNNPLLCDNIRVLIDKDGLTRKSSIEGTFYGAFMGMGHTINYEGKNGGMFGENMGIICDFEFVVKGDFETDNDYFGCLADVNGSDIWGIVVNSEKSKINIKADNTTVGGLIGKNTALVSNCGVNINITTNTKGDVGGIIGNNRGKCWMMGSRGNITATNSSSLGGAIGVANGELVSIGHQGDVRGKNNVGGLIGKTEYALEMQNCNTNDEFSDDIGGDSPLATNVTGVNNVGGLIGEHSGNKLYQCTVNLTDNSTITGENNVGGLIGLLKSEKIEKCSCIAGDIKGNEYVGLLVGKADHLRYHQTVATILNCYGRLLGDITGKDLVSGFGNTGDGIKVVVDSSYVYFKPTSEITATSGKETLSYTGNMSNKNSYVVAKSDLSALDFTKVLDDEALSDAVKTLWDKEEWCFKLGEDRNTGYVHLDFQCSGVAA